MIFDNVLGIMGYKISGETTPMLKCSCSKEKAEASVISLGKEELDEIIAEEIDVPLVCEYCKTEYIFTKNDLIKLRDSR
jgi:molecular chaperone Hsp33